MWAFCSLWGLVINVFITSLYILSYGPQKSNIWLCISLVLLFTEMLGLIWQALDLMMVSGELLAMFWGLTTKNIVFYEDFVWVIDVEIVDCFSEVERYFLSIHFVCLRQHRSGIMSHRRVKQVDRCLALSFD